LSELDTSKGSARLRWRVAICSRRQLRPLAGVSRLQPLCARQLEPVTQSASRPGFAAASACICLLALRRPVHPTPFLQFVDAVALQLLHCRPDLAAQLCHCIQRAVPAHCACARAARRLTRSMPAAAALSTHADLLALAMCFSRELFPVLLLPDPSQASALLAPPPACLSLFLFRGQGPGSRLSVSL